MGRRVCERFDHLQQLDDRARPAVRHEQRYGLIVRRADVRELDVQPVDLGDELGQLVELSLDLAPVVVGAPVLDERPELRQLDTLGPISDGLGVGPPCRRHAPAEVEEILFRHVDAEGAYRGCFPNHTCHLVSFPWIALRFMPTKRWCGVAAWRVARTTFASPPHSD
jgi:hypothetical protein